MQTDLFQAIYYLSEEHYLDFELNDELSERILTRYLKLLDSNKEYFYASDIEKFRRYQFDIDDHLSNANLDLGFAIYTFFRQRVKEREVYVNNLLSQEFDFSLEEAYSLDGEGRAWANSVAELNNLWRKKVKNQALIQQFSDTPKDQINKNISKAYANISNIVWQNKPEEVFELYLNALTQEIGPHTQYMSRVTAENFRIQMSLSLEGIGASLTSDSTYTVVNKIMPGGPADKSGLLKAEDKIIGVGQSFDGIEDVTGWRLMDVVQKIRGKKGTNVFLKKFNGGDVSSTPETISITRDVIQLEDNAAKLEFQKVQNKVFAIIELPLFYANYRVRSTLPNTSNDVRLLIEKAKEEENLAGIILDLRNNGGGYLGEAIKLTGLFIDKGPVVQIKESGYTPHILKDTDSGTVYDGPLAVLVNQNSASASEIFAAAIQDYGRGLVIGERTFGKGTVQEVKALSSPEAGKAQSNIKLTIQQFFRINGGSTQVKGVTPDIKLSIGDRGSYGERELDNALPWSKIGHAEYNANTIIGIQSLNNWHRARAKISPAFNYLRASNKLQKENTQITVVPLNKKSRKKWNTMREAQRLNIVNQYRESLNLNPITKDSLSKITDDLPDKDKHWDRIYQRESALILNDYINTLH